MGFQVESSSYCPSGVAPRWTWLIRGIRGNSRYEYLGTDEQGSGLYLFRFVGDKAPIREELLDRYHFTIPSHHHQSRRTGTPHHCAGATRLGTKIGNAPCRLNQSK